MMFTAPAILMITAPVIEKEDFCHDLYQEVLPLGRKCWEESTLDKGADCGYHGERDFQIEPDFEVYERVASNGSMVLLTLRDNGALKGYVVGFTYRSWHHKDILCANVDSIYVEPSHRAYTAVIAEKLEKEFRLMGVQIIGWPTRINGPVYDFLMARGYVGDDIVMEK